MIVLVVTGYKFTQEAYNDVNIVINLIGFCIYKSYYVSEKRTKYCDPFKLLTEELKTLIAYLESKKKMSPFISTFVKAVN